MGFAKHPLDILREKKFDSLEVADALRLAIIAELDAISLYLPLAKYVDDERVRKVFEDVAREEKAHFGEFLALLKTYDPGLEAELKAGAEEVREKTGLEAVDPPAAGGGWIDEVAATAREAASSARRFRKHLAWCIKPGRGRRRWLSAGPLCLLGSWTLSFLFRIGRLRRF
jgi:rubrerythrin